MKNNISSSDLNLRVSVNTETGNSLSDSGDLLSGERSLQKTANVLNAVDLSVNTNNFATLNHSFTQVRLANNSSTDTVLSDEEYPLQEDNDILRELILPIDSELFFQVLEQFLGSIEEKPLPEKTSLRGYLHHMLTVSNSAVSRIYSQANEFEKQLLQPLVDSSPQLITLLSKEGNMLSQASESEKDAYGMWYHLMMMLTSNAPLSAIDDYLLYPEPNIQGTLSGSVKSEALRDTLSQLPYLTKINLILDDAAAKELSNCEVPKFLRQLTFIYHNDKKSISGEQVSQALQQFAFSPEIRSIILVPNSDNIRSTFNIPPLELSHLASLTRKNEKLKDLKLFIPITDPQVIKRLHQIFPQLEKINFNLRATAPEDYVEMRAALKLFTQLKERLYFLSQLYPKAQNNNEELSDINKTEIKIQQQQETIQDLIHTCLPDLSTAERSALIGHWQVMLDKQSSEIDFSAFITLLFSHDAATCCLLRSPEYRDPIHGIKLRQAIGTILQALPNDPELAAMCAAYAHEAISTCRDKTILAFRDCVKAVTVSTLLKNPVMLSRSQLVTLGTSLFQEEQLKAIVQSHLNDLQDKDIDSDEVEETLSFISQLAKQGKINLISPVRRLRHGVITQVTYQQTLAAQNTILEAVAQQPDSGAAIGLATSEIWHRYLHSQVPTLLQQYRETVQDPLFEEMQNLYDQRLQLADRDYQQQSQAIKSRLEALSHAWYCDRTQEYLDTLVS
ncbi:NEL domain-containing protein [unidentified bacterial endosymbiont]|uniref:NEL domain-containing protein n=1 Tax=unidentified bacterial endosymbiont TaxID=2355 RepID=UPI00209D09AF|nr:NEL domain-containing protein [unidentified bacterial endosymbiont]